eukprot:CAMPEP_0176287518 /NCGR_PEP_ID=MMETSP0121_2-20121125/53479_1 /TAXON_ID=160619 /ORGANISM="Kryptoperidinium foliaceum, Strain CCMP 1326" /LENGTH=78 /DNA_ID=CAMNT_0017628141 /DNA_START=47 /DNA_END=280 /DNA_ORIENTATION=+
MNVVKTRSRSCARSQGHPLARKGMARASSTDRALDARHRFWSYRTSGEGSDARGVDPLAAASRYKACERLGLSGCRGN